LFGAVIVQQCGHVDRGHPQPIHAHEEPHVFADEKRALVDGIERLRVSGKRPDRRTRERLDRPEEVAGPPPVPVV